jgi:hypothetical protein
MLTVQFISEPPHTNWGVEVSYSDQPRPDAILNKLEELGWIRCIGLGLGDKAQWRFVKQYDIVWTDKERKAEVLAVRRAMEPFGIHNIAHKKLR